MAQRFCWTVGVARLVSTPSPKGLARDCHRHDPDGFPEFGQCSPDRFRPSGQFYQGSALPLSYGSNSVTTTISQGGFSAGGATLSTLQPLRGFARDRRILPASSRLFPCFGQDGNDAFLHADGTSRTYAVSCKWCAARHMSRAQRLLLKLGFGTLF